MTRAAGGERAWEACGEYETWAAAVRRLTEEIAAIQCPNESEVEQDTHWPGSPSCFSIAREQRRPESYHGDGNPPRPLRLNEIEPLVADCPECSRLVKLIRARKVARQRYGVAKRKVRAVGKVATRTPTTEHYES